MKVKLAAQLFSSSVADALQYLNLKLKRKEFEGSEATVAFIRHVDAAFDILNSRNPLAKGMKAPLFKDHFELKVKALQEAEQFFMNLKDTTGKFLHKGQRKTGFIGFSLSIKAFLQLHKDLVLGTDAPLRYLLGYKLSQDHLELFFSAVRTRGGNNNNPTVRQFKTAYKRLLMRHQIKNKTGNCIPMDDTVVLHVDCHEVIKTYELLTPEPAEEDHDYAALPVVEQISEYKVIYDNIFTP